VRIGFGPFALDLGARQLTRDGREIHLTPKAFDLLAALVRERPEVMSKQVLQERLWPGTFVAEANLSNLVAEIRKALGERGRPVWIRTAHGVGYAFCGDAALLAAPAPRLARDRPACWLVWGRRQFPLTTGEHVIGRDPDVAIRLDATTVSRRHARIVVSETRAVLEDLGSKNGVRRGEERITHAVELADGDAVHIGSLLLTFHTRPLVVSTETHESATR
jgi:DNA-binding winged helix-turn-helix (wHTH) protein